MRSLAIVVVLSIVFCSASGWSEIKYFKIPDSPEEPDKVQETSPEDPDKVQETPPEDPDKVQETPPQEPSEPEPVQPDEKDVKKKKPRVDTPTKSATPKTGDPKTASPKSKPPKTVGTKKQKPRGSYITSLQISSFQTLDQANKEKSRFKALGIDAFIRHEKVRGEGMLYMVYIGKFKSKRQALDYEQKLKREGIIHWSWIKRLPATPSQVPIVSMPSTKPKPASKKAAPSQKPAMKTIRKPTPVKRPAKPAPGPVIAVNIPKHAVVPKKTKHPTQPSKKSTTKTAAKGKPLSGKFSIGPHVGLLFAPNSSDFRITRTIGSTTENWEFENFKPLAGITIGWRFSDHWSLDTVVEKVVMTNLEMEHHTLGPKMYFKDSGTIRTYVRAALVYGRLAWDDAPGDFDSSLGAEVGFGIDFLGSDYSFGLEAAYRYMTFDYGRPSGTSVTSTDSQIDFSGFTLSACARALF